MASAIAPTAQDGLGEPSKSDVVVRLLSSAPEGAEQDIAREYGVELIEHRTVLGMRIAHYRFRDTGAAAQALANLERDHRVSSVQPNVEYQRVTLEEPQTSESARLPSERKAFTTEHKANGELPVGSPGRAERKAAGGKVRRKTPARDVASTGGDASSKSRPSQERAAVPNKRTALRFPSADEPFVSVGSMD